MFLNIIAGITAIVIIILVWTTFSVMRSAKMAKNYYLRLGERLTYNDYCHLVNTYDGRVSLMRQDIKNANLLIDRIEELDSKDSAYISRITPNLDRLVGDIVATVKSRAVTLNMYDILGVLTDIYPEYVELYVSDEFEAINKLAASDDSLKNDVILTMDKYIESHPIDGVAYPHYSKLLGRLLIVKLTDDLNVDKCWDLKPSCYPEDDDE